MNIIKIDRVYMKIRLLFFIFITFILTSCFHEDNFENSKKGNFEALWTIFDQKYCFFEYKKDFVDWDEVYTRYSARVEEEMTDEEFFYVMGEMLNELKDGHVNLVAKHDRIRYLAWFEDYPKNFDANIQEKYYLGTGTDYRISGGIKYRILEDNIGYLYYGDFSISTSLSQLDHIIKYLMPCDGIIVDVRNNGGGALTNSERLAERFFKEKTLVGYIQHTTGKGHDSFSKPYAQYITPPNDRLRYQGPVVVLTNRSSYSATNDFVNSMRYAPNAVIVGDKTGGGSGLPFSSEIPNGWSVRFSASPIHDASMEHIEFGIDPDLFVDMDTNLREIDTIIETARKVIKNEIQVNKKR